MIQNLLKPEQDRQEKNDIQRNKTKKNNAIEELCLEAHKDIQKRGKLKNGLLKNVTNALRYNFSKSKREQLKQGKM